MRRVIVVDAGAWRDLRRAEHTSRIKILQSDDLHPPHPEEFQVSETERKDQPQHRGHRGRAEKPERPSQAAALSHRTSSGATRVMSPAPSVSTTSPGSSASRTRRPTSARTGSKRASAPGLDGRLRHLAPAHAGHRLLARGVDLSHEHQVGRGECLPHRIAMGDRARVEVRLEDGDEPSPRKRLPRGRQRGRELRRMVSVVVHHRDTTVLAEPLEPAAHAGECGQGLDGGLQGATQRIDRGQSAHGISQIVDSGNREPQPSFAASAPRNRGLRAASALLHLADSNVGIGGEAEPHGTGHVRGHALGARIVCTHERDPSASREFDEGILERLHRAIALQMVGLDVVDDRHRGVEREERLVVLVGLDHEEVVAVDQSVSAPGRDPPARQSRWDAGRPRPRLRWS